MSCLSLKNKIRITVTNDFQKFVDKFNRKTNKIWIDKNSKFYNGPMKSWAEDIQHIMNKNLLLLKDLLEP